MSIDAKPHEDGVDRSGKLRIVVAALTRRRPLMLRNLLKSWGEMSIPDRCTVTCLIVENDNTDYSRSIVEEMSPLPNGLTIEYALEVEPGIPFGRNRAAREAIAHNADLLAFVDDDEMVARDWLVEFILGYRNSKAALLGAPLYVGEPVPSLGIIERTIYKNQVSRYRHQANRASRRATLDTTKRVTVVTNNWLAETSLFSENQIWFDEYMRYTGGTDAKFCAEVKARNIKVGWVDTAHVFETIPRNRLTFRYQYERGRDQSATHFHRKRALNKDVYLGLVIAVPLKSSMALLALAAIPLTGGKTLLRFARTTGWIVGRVTAAFGYRSRLYESTTGF